MSLFRDTRLEPLLDGGVKAGAGRIAPLQGQGEPADVAIGSEQHSGGVDVSIGGGAAHVDDAFVANEGVGEVVVAGEVEEQAAAGVHQRAEPGGDAADDQVDIGHSGADQRVVVAAGHRVPHVKPGHHAGEIAVGVGQPREVGDDVAQRGNVAGEAAAGEHPLGPSVVQDAGGHRMAFGVIAVE